jgi:ubiquinol-cytochrome c reductase cytochrome c subunit
MRRTLATLACALLVGAAAVAWSTRDVAAQGTLIARGAALYAQTCSDCHGADLRGRPGRAPTLHGVGTASTDFYLRTGRMPLARPGIEPARADPVFDARDIQALVAYVAERGGPGGPAIPAVDPARGDVAEGRRLFTDSCSGCHQIMGRGGAGPGFVAPALTGVTPREVGEAIRVGPYVMPAFSSRRLDDRQVASIARYVDDVVQDPPNRGGWGIGHLGPIPEGAIAFLLAGSVLLLITRLIGERARP